MTVGDNATLECVSMSQLEPMVYWYKHVIINEENKTSEHVIQLQRSGVNVTHPDVYHILNATFEDAGKYSCYVYNNYGRKMADAYVTVVERELNFI